MEVVRVEVSDNAAILVESGSEDSVVEVGRASDLAASGVAAFSSAMDSIREAAGVAVARITDMPKPPSEIALTFAIQLAAEAGVVVAKTAATANMSVTLQWKDSPRDQT